MAKPVPEYRKLTRLKRGLGTMSQLCLGSDHLLHIVSTGYTESYRRFYLRDIQALLLVHTARRAIYGTALGAIGIIVSGMMVSAGASGVAMTIVLATFAALMLWNQLRGEGCRLVVVTAVQQESVPALCRLPRARKILAELRPLIEAAQADLAVLAAQPDQADPGAGASAPPIPPPLPPPLPTPAS